MTDRTLAPKTSMPSKLDLVQSQQFTLSNGLKVNYFNGCSEPVINLSILLKAGKYYQEKDWASYFTMALLKKGTKNRSLEDLEEKIDFLGASLSTESNLFLSNISLSCLSEKFADILPIVGELINESIFPEEEIELEKNKQIQKLKVNQTKNNYLSSVHFSKAIFGANHPCGKLNTEESIKALTREDILNHYNNILNLDEETRLILSGNIDGDTLRLINDTIGKITLQARKNKALIKFETETEKNVDLKIAESVQASLRLGMPLEVNPEHEDFLDLEIVNRVFGGYFGSRLMKNIREEKGYTYGIYSFISNFELGSYFCIATDVGLDYKEDTLKEISKEIIRLQNEPISAEELDMVKNYHKGRIMKSIDGSMRMANVLSLLLPLGLNEDYVNKRLEAVENITAERIMLLANKYLNFEIMHKVIVA